MAAHIHDTRWKKAVCLADSSSITVIIEKNLPEGAGCICSCLVIFVVALPTIVLGIGIESSGGRKSDAKAVNQQNPTADSTALYRCMIVSGDRYMCSRKDYQGVNNSTKPKALA